MTYHKKNRGKFYIAAVVVLSVAVVLFLINTIVTVCLRNGGDAIAAKKIADKLAGGFNCTANVSYGGNHYQVSLLRTPSGDCEMTFTKPDVLNSLSFEAGKSGLKVKFGSLEAAVDPSSIPQSALFTAVRGALDSCVADSVALKPQPGGFGFVGSSPAGKFSITLDKNNSPSSLSFPALKLTAQFSNFSYTA